MKISVVKVGKINSKEVLKLIGEYKKRLSSGLKIEYIEVKGKASEASDVLAIEALRKSTGTFICLLDERGKNLSSPALAKFVKLKQENPSVKSLVFLVGGPFGFDEKARKSVDYSWSLSNAVFPNDLATLLVWEQLYRAQSILTGSKYHHS